MPQQPTALIVEDEADMATEIADLLRAFGHACLHAATFVEAQERLAEGGFCYILLDLEIKWDSQSIKPRLESGMSLLRDIRKRYPRRNDNDMHQVPVIVVSGHGKESKNIIGAFKDGVDDFLMKPLGAGGQDIGATINRCLALAGRSEHDACDARAQIRAADVAERHNDGETFWHAPDYSEIRLRGAQFHFAGDVNRAVVRALHEAAVAGQPWQSGKAILAKAGSQDAEAKMRNLFAGQSCWGRLLLSDRRGKYRLITE